MCKFYPFSVINSTWNINVHRYNSVTASDDSVRIVVVASSVSTAGKEKKKIQSALFKRYTTAATFHVNVTAVIKTLPSFTFSQIMGS